MKLRLVAIAVAFAALGVPFLYSQSPEEKHAALVGKYCLTCAEYANAIRDVLDLKVDAAALLPPDDSAFGFDAVGTWRDRESGAASALIDWSGTLLDGTAIRGPVELRKALLKKPEKRKLLRLFLTHSVYEV